MEFLSDNFISYDDEFLVKQEKATGPTIPLDSFFSVDPAFAFAEPIPQTLKNLLENDDQSFTLDPCDYEAWSTDRKKRQPFNIIKTKKEETRLCSPESFEVKIESDDKLVSRTKRILKREKAKQRIKIKQEGNVSVACEDSTTASEVINNPDLDGKTKKKMIQMIRNRISAQSSRDRKKVYMLQLEDAKSQLMDENSKLNLEKEVLLKEFKKLEETQRKLKNENEGLKKSMAQNNGLGYQFSRDGDSNTDEAEDESEGQEFSNMFKTIIGSGFGKLTGNNKKLYKSTLALATMISVVMMLNIAKQGGAIVEDGADWIKNSNLSGIQKKLLQNQELAEDLQELTEEISSSKQWDFFDRLKPLLQNLEAEHRKLSMDTQCEGTTTGTPHSPPNMVKMEELAQEDLLAEPECLLPAMDSKMGSIFGEERMNVESFRHGSDMRIVGMNTVRYFGSKNMIKFTQQNDPSQYVVKRESQRDDLFVKDEWHQVMRNHNAASFSS